MLVSGRVQGVFYRASCAEEARRLGLVGMVRNLRDGRVEVEAEGDESAVEALVAWCRHGPEQARVTGVEVDDREPEGGVRFAVR
jgi:acylphosphatase